MFNVKKWSLKYFTFSFDTFLKFVQNFGLSFHKKILFLYPVFKQNTPFYYWHLSYYVEATYVFKSLFTSLFVYCYFSVAQLCSTLCDLMDCSLTVSSVHGVSQAKILERVAIPFSRESSWPSDWTCGFSTTELPGKPIYVNCIRRQKHFM